MYGSEFDGNAAFSGGGFMPSQATQTADPSFSPAKRSDTQTLIPLTVKQIREAFLSSDDKVNFLIDGVDVNNAKLVGMVLNKAERLTEVSFVLDDGTGRIDCIRWTQEAVETKEMSVIQEGMYVRVHGHLKGFQGKKQLVIFGCKPVTDHNEIANHFVECIYVHTYNTKSKGSSSNQAHAAPSNQAYAAPSNQAYAASSNQFAAGQYIDKMVLDYLQQPPCLVREKGVHRNELVQQLGVPLEKILEALEALEGEGLVYSTIDQFHYKSTVNG